MIRPPSDSLQSPQPLGGWGRCPVQPCFVERPRDLERLRDLVAHGPQADYIARGCGRSYGDSALNADSGVLDQTALDFLVSFDSDTGILQCEAGVTLAQIISSFLPRGWFLPITPGTKYVTVGGAIAADVHGKNSHRDGSFGKFVIDLQLCTARGEVLSCSAEENPDLFRATIGGMGLTGVIVSARLRLMRVNSGYCQVTYQPTRDLEQTFELLKASEDSSQYCVAWMDGMARRESMGRSIVMLGEHAPADRLPAALAASPFAMPARRSRSIPLNLPSLSLNRATIMALNGWYYAQHSAGERLVDLERFFYPLDGVHHWNRAFGRRGFVQYQALFPPESAWEGVRALLAEIVNSRQLVTLIVLKGTGHSDAGLLSFVIPGITITLDFPNTGEPLRRLARALDKILLRFGGRLYLAKDALTDGATIAPMYPALDTFLAVKQAVDPTCRFVSSQARRLGWVPSA